MKKYLFSDTGQFCRTKMLIFKKKAILKVLLLVPVIWICSLIFFAATSTNSNQVTRNLILSIIFSEKVPKTEFPDRIQ